MKNGFHVDMIEIIMLDLLQNDAKLTAKTLGDRIALSQTPVYERIKKLERNGVIQKYVALLDPAKLGQNLVIFMNISLGEHRVGSREEVIDSLVSLPEVSELYQTSGRYDFLAKVRLNQIVEYRNFLVEKVAEIPNIKDIDSLIVLETIKHSTTINLPVKVA